MPAYPDRALHWRDCIFMVLSLLCAYTRRNHNERVMLCMLHSDMLIILDTSTCVPQTITWSGFVNCSNRLVQHAPLRAMLRVLDEHPTTQ